MITTLYINNKEVDLGKNEAIVLINKQYEDLTNPTNYYADWTKTIKVPYSRQNNEIFENSFRADSTVTSTSTVDPTKRIPFILLNNNKIMMRGYCKVNIINFSKTNRCYEINLFSTLGECLNDLKQLTFNMNADVESKYKIPSPFTTTINASLVKQSWNRTSHQMSVSSTNALDYIGFLASYQGTYPDFSSDSVESRMPGETNPVLGEDYQQDVDEHYEREYRSYYQQPYIYVDKLWQLAKKQFETFSDYKLKLSERWFNALNPYYKDLIYTCPSLYDTEMETAENKVSQNMGHSSYYAADPLFAQIRVTNQSDLSNHHRQILKFPFGGANYFCNPQTGLFNGGNVHSNSGTLKLSGEWMLFAGSNDGRTDGWCKIRKDNCVYFEFKAVRASNMSEITGTKYRVQLYSSSTNCSSSGCDYSLDVGIASRSNPCVVTFPTAEGHGRNDGFYWTGCYNLEMNINTPDPFYVVLDVFTANNSKPFETSFASWMPRWDWLWSDMFTTTDPCASCGDKNKGMTFYLPYAGTNKYEGYVNIRSESAVDMSRVFPKDKPLFDVLLNYCKMFGLYFDLDEDNKELKVMDRNEFFEDYEILDWTDKVDRNKDFQMKPVSFENEFVNFNYDEGNGQRFEAYEKKYNANYGSKKINTGYKFNSEVKDLYEGLVPAMVCSKKQDSYYFNTHFPDSPNFKGFGYKEMTQNYFVENDDEGSNANISGAFYFHNGKQAVSPNLQVTDSNGNYSVRITDDSAYQIKNNSYLWSWFGPTQMSQYFPAVSPFSKQNKYSVYFEAPKEYYFYRPAIGSLDNTKYIYPYFWKKYIDERYSIQNKVLTAYFYLTTEDVTHYKFNKFVKIDNLLYLPNKIVDFDINGKESTKVELIQVLDITAYTHSYDPLPYIDVESVVYVSDDDYTEEIVHSSSNWQVYNITNASWLSYRSSGSNGESLHLKANTPLSGSPRTAVLWIRNDDTLVTSITVRQIASSDYLRVSRNTVTFTSNGGEVSVSYESSPENVQLVSKPNWVDVRFDHNVLREIPNTFREIDYSFDVLTPGSTVSLHLDNPTRTMTRFEQRLIASPTLSRAYNDMTVFKKSLNTASGIAYAKRITPGQVEPVVRQLTENIIVINTLSRNTTRFTRSGYVVITNGVKTTRIRVTQNASRTIVIGSEEPAPVHPIHITSADFELPMVSYKEMVPNSLYISTGTITKNTPNIDEMLLTVNPVMNRTRSGEPPDGGVITCDTVDGETIVEHYNTGEVMQKRQVMFRSDGHCTILVIVNNVGHQVGEGDVYYDELEVGTGIAVAVTPSSGHLWSHWSDDDENATRTFTVADDDILLTAYTEPEDDLLQYDDGVDVAWDDTTTVSLHDGE